MSPHRPVEQCGTMIGNPLPTIREGKMEDRQSRFFIYSTDRVHLTSVLFSGGDWHWEFCGPSGVILADCGGYLSERDCRAAVAAIIRDAATAKVTG